MFSKHPNRVESANIARYFEKQRCVRPKNKQMQSISGTFSNNQSVHPVLHARRRGGGEGRRKCMQNLPEKFLAPTFYRSPFALPKIVLSRDSTTWYRVLKERWRCNKWVFRQYFTFGQTTNSFILPRQKFADSLVPILSRGGRYFLCHQGR